MLFVRTLLDTPGGNILIFTCMADISNLRRVRNMKTRRILPASCNDNGQSVFSEERELYLQIHLGLVLSQAGNSSEQRLPLHATLGEDEEEGADEGEVTEQELEVPEDAVGYCL